MSAEVAPAGRRVWYRVFSRHAMNIALLMAAPMLIAEPLSKSLTLLRDPDIWWHLANARLLLTTHHFIQVDPYCFTVMGQRWINWEWLSELPFWFSYQWMGLQGIYLFTWLILAANTLVLYWRGYATSRHAGAALWAALIGLALMTVNAGPRTIGIAYLAMSGELAILEAAEQGYSQLLWLLPPLFCLWINLHGTWLIGLVLLAIYIACGLVSLNVGIFEQNSIPARERNRLLLVMAASVAATIVNPYGWRLMWEPFDMAFKQKLSVSVIDEWQPLHLSMPQGKVAVAAIFLMVLANAIRSRKWKLYELAFVFLAWYAAFAHMRFLFFAAVLTTPLLARDMQRVFFTESDKKTIPAMNALMVVGAMCVILWAIPTKAQLESRLADMYPLKTIGEIQPEWRTLDWFPLGGMMDLASKPNAIDSRLDSFDHYGVLGDYLSMMSGQNAFELLEKYRIDHVLVKKSMPLAYLLERSTAWRVLSREQAEGGDEFVLFAKGGRSGMSSGDRSHTRDELRP